MMKSPPDTVVDLLQHRETGIRGAEPAGRQRRHFYHRWMGFKANKEVLTRLFSGQIYIWPVTIQRGLKEFTVNKWR